MTNNEPIYVTRPHLPPLEDFIPYLQKIWDNKVLTHGGPFEREFEGALRQYLGVNHVSLLVNGTLALVTALQALRISGEVITTPFSYVATTHSLLLNGIDPVFVDVSPNEFNLDVDKIEAAITPRTTAIMPVHCYGYPCEVERIQAIASKHNLKVIYDAAHAFGVRYRGNSLLNYGDLSILSFHATKVFNTFEGGAIICQDKETKLFIDQLKNFGFVDPLTVSAVGTNAKMNEFSAALGLLQLKHVDYAITRRKEITGIYIETLRDVKGMRICQTPLETKGNYGYFPILIEADYPISRDELYQELEESNIHARRYFYPLISDFATYRGLASAQPENLPVATDIALKVLCLPLYPALTANDIQRVVSIVRRHS